MISSCEPCVCARKRPSGRRLYGRRSQAAGRGADVEAVAARRVDPACVERGRALLAATGPGGAAAPGNTISVQPVGEESLKAGESVPAKPAANGDPKGEKTAAADENKSENTATVPPPKTKGNFHFFKQIVKPF